MDSKKPKRKQFSETKYKATISKLRKNMPGTMIEKFSEGIAVDILNHYEGFERIEKGPHFGGTPFDFFAFKNGSPYIIELKSSLNYFSVPGETQKRRMRELLEIIPALKVALLQIALKKYEYRFFSHEHMKEFLFPNRRAPLGQIEGWIRERIND
jgi:hypothetical protein